MKILVIFQVVRFTSMFNPSLQTIWGGEFNAVFCDTGWKHPDTINMWNDVVCKWV